MVPLYGSSFDEIDSPSEQLLELTLGASEVEERPWSIRRKGHQNVYIAVGVHVSACRRTEEREINHLPATTEVIEYRLRR